MENRETGPNGLVNFPLSKNCLILSVTAGTSFRVRRTAEWSVWFSAAPLAALRGERMDHCTMGSMGDSHQNSDSSSWCPQKLCSQIWPALPSPYGTDMAMAFWESHLLTKPQSSCSTLPKGRGAACLQPPTAQHQLWSMPCHSPWGRGACKGVNSSAGQDLLPRDHQSTAGCVASWSPEPRFCTQHLRSLKAVPESWRQNKKPHVKEQTEAYAPFVARDKMKYKRW